MDVQTTGDDILYIRTGTNETKPTANFQEILEGNVNNVNSSTNLTVASITATGSTNDIDLRNNIIAGTGINLTQISNTTGIAVDPAPLNAEIARATAAEGVNATDIAAEIARATAAEGVNATNIAAEITRATTAEGVNATAITTKQDTITGSTALTTGALTATATTNDIDLRNNITAGNQITLTQTGNVTSIACGAAVGTSTQYGWCASSTLSGTSTLSSGTILQFDTLTGQTYRDFEVPSGAGNYSTSGYYYEVAVAGYYQVGFNLYTINAEATAITAVVKDVVGARGTYLTIGETGQDTRSNEDFKVIANFNVGDRIYVRSSTGIVLNWVNSATFFYGFLLQPVNNTVTSSTDLTINSLTINTDLNSETFIRTVACAKILSSGNNSKAINCSVARTAVGRFTFTFTNPRPSVNYVINLTIAENSVTLDDVLIQVVNGTQTAAGFNYYIHEQDNGTGAGTYVDRPSFVSIFDTD